MLPIIFDKTVDGYAAFSGPCELGFKLAVINTKHNQGLVRNGIVLYEDMPRSSWTVHFTSPHMLLEECEAIIKSLPAEA